VAYFLAGMLRKSAFRFALFAVVGAVLTVRWCRLSL
jgi:membrane protein DedA with SNARE-associated domain